MAFGASDAARWQSYQTRARIGANLWLLLFRLALLSWLVLTMWIVWHETGEAFPQLNHAYFWTWVGVGLLTDVPILNLAAAHAKWPINGVWVPLPALAQSLNGQQFYWQPFVTWYWHYDRWTILIPPAVFVLALVIRFRGDKDTEHVRGPRLLAPRLHNLKLNGGWLRKAARVVKRSTQPVSLKLGSSVIPREKEYEHFLAMGSSGSGKSTLIRTMLEQIRDRGQAAVVVDPESEYVQEFYDPARGDAVLNPLDQRCPFWSPWEEFRDGLFDMDAAALAASFISDGPNLMTSNGVFFNRAARTVLESIFRAVQPHEAEAITALLAKDRKGIKDALAHTPAAASIDPQAHDQGAGIVATVANAIKPLEFLPRRNDSHDTWSACKWATRPKGWLFLASTEDSRDAVRPLQSVWLDALIRWLMTAEIGSQQVWLIIDELKTLGYQAQLERLVTGGRKRGLCAVMGFQDVSQLRSIYGRDRSITLVSSPSTKVILRCDEAETAKWASDQLGSREIVRTNMTALTGVSTNREGINLQPHRSSEHIVTAGEIQLLQPLKGYLCIAGYDRTTIRVPTHFLRRRQPAFMPRMLRSGKETSAGATQLGRAEVWS